MARESQALPAAAPCIVDYLDGRLIDRSHSDSAKPPAEVHVFVIEKISLVEAAQRAVGIAPEEHEHSRHPVYVELPAVDRVLGFPAVDKKLFRQ